MTSGNSKRPEAQSINWINQQLEELKASGSPAYEDVLDQLIKINGADLIARNAYLHGKTPGDDYIEKLAHRLMDIQFDAEDPAKEFPYRRDNGKPVSLYATTLLRKFEAMLINERLNDVQGRLDADARRMAQTGLVPADNIVKPGSEWSALASEWANTDPDTIKPDEVLVDADFGHLEELPKITPVRAPAPPYVPPVADKWSVDSVIKAELVIRHNLKTLEGDKLAGYVGQTLKPLHQEVLAELQQRAGQDGDKLDDSYLLSFMTSVRGHIKEANARIAPAITITPKVPSNVPADAQKFLDKAAISARAHLAVSAPEKKSWRERLAEVGTSAKNLVSGVGRWLGQAAETLTSKPVRQAAAGILLGTVATTAQHAETHQGFPEATAKVAHTFKADKLASARVDSPVLTVPVAVAAAPAAPVAEATEQAAPVVKVAAVSRTAHPAAATPRAAKVDFSVQATSPVSSEVPDELSVSFNGKKLRADVFTVKAACDQIGNASSICENFVPPAPTKG